MRQNEKVQTSVKLFTFTAVLPKRILSCQKYVTPHPKKRHILKGFCWYFLSEMKIFHFIPNANNFEKWHYKVTWQNISCPKRCSIFSIQNTKRTMSFLTDFGLIAEITCCSCIIVPVCCVILKLSQRVWLGIV